MKKFCFVARETKKGWRLGGCLGSKISYMNFYFKTMEDVSAAIKNNIVFIHLAETKGGKKT